MSYSRKKKEEEEEERRRRGGKERRKEKTSKLPSQKVMRTGWSSSRIKGDIGYEMQSLKPANVRQTNKLCSSYLDG